MDQQIIIRKMNKTLQFRTVVSNEVNEKDWNESLLKSPYSTAFQEATFFKPDKLVFDAKQVFIKVLDNSGNIVGQFSGVLRFKEHRNISNPLSKLLFNKLNLGSTLTWKEGPIIHDLENHDKICSEIFDTINKLCHKYKIEKIKGTTPPLDPNFSKNTFSNTNFLVTPWKDHIITLPKNPEKYFTSLDKKVRYDIRKGENNNLTFEIAKTMDDFNDFAMLKFKNRKNPKEILEHSKTEIQATWKILYETGLRILFLAKHKGEITCGINSILFNKILYQTTVVNSSNTHLQSGSFLTWNFIKWAIENDCSYVDLSGANPNPISEKEKQIDFYKSKWGGKEYKMYLISKVLSKKRSKFGSLLRRL